jgi:hypothetical protein
MHASSYSTPTFAGGQAKDVDNREVANAILRTVAYSDVFQFPLTSAEIHRYLDGVRVSQQVVASVLANGGLVPSRLTINQGYYTLPGSEAHVSLRLERSFLARRMWPTALHYGRFISGLPFVRMVAVTGSLAVNNPAREADIDYLIVTESGRLWLSRFLIVALARYAARRGTVLCPNYLLSENALVFGNQDLYASRELAQMVPLFGRRVYDRVRRLNQWTDRFLPNALGPPSWRAPKMRSLNLVQSLAELPLRTPVGQWMDIWEMSRKIHKFQCQGSDFTEASFSRNWCKGHFNAHHDMAMSSYRRRLRKTPSKTRFVVQVVLPKEQVER